MGLKFNLKLSLPITNLHNEKWKASTHISLCFSILAIQNPQYGCQFLTHVFDLSPLGHTLVLSLPSLVLAVNKVVWGRGALS